LAESYVIATLLLYMQSGKAKSIFRRHSVEIAQKKAGHAPRYCFCRNVLSGTRSLPAAADSSNQRLAILLLPHYSANSASPANCAVFLPPVTFDQNILAMAMDPVVGDPVLASLRRSIVAARRPDIMVAFVAVIAGLPFVSLAGRWAAPFIHWRGWSHANHDLRKRCRRDQG
jgi:hypothetical protein